MMNEVLHANIFFAITALAVVIFTILLCVALFHIIRLIQSARKIVERIQYGTEVLSDDVQSIRNHLATGGVVKKVWRFLFSTKVDEDSRDDATTYRRGSGLED